jgi:hypothetical protein
MLTTVLAFLDLSSFKLVERTALSGGTEYTVTIKVDGHDIKQVVAYSNGRFYLSLDPITLFIPVELRRWVVEITGKGVITPYSKQREAVEPGCYASKRHAVTAEVTEYLQSAGITGLSVAIRAKSLDAFKQFVSVFAIGQRRPNQRFIRRADTTSFRSRPRAQA